MEQLLRKVTKELDNISDKGLTSSNLDTTFKLIDIYKDIKEACYYDKMVEEDGSYGGRGSNGRYRDDYGRMYRDNDDDDRYGRRGGRGNYGHYPLDERIERHLQRMIEALCNYDEGRNRYRNGDSKDRMIDGVEMAMGALVNFVEYMMDNVETSLIR